MSYESSFEGTMVFPECFRALLQVLMLPDLIKVMSVTRISPFVYKGCPNSQMKQALNERVLRLQYLIQPFAS